MKSHYNIDLPCVYHYIFTVTDCRLVYTHLIALRYSSDCNEDGYGLTLNTGRPSDGVKVNWTSLSFIISDTLC